jgi:hypothetical protein
VSDDKKTRRLDVWVSEPLELDLHRLAARDDRKLSEYIGMILARHVYGHLSTTCREPEGALRCEAGRCA